MKVPDARPVRTARRRVDGILLVDKPRGLSSNAVLQYAKRLYAAEKAGHAGTLDPLATGLLPLCFGEATKYAQMLLDARKEYVATVRFGVATSTGDAEGEPTRVCEALFSRADFINVLPRFEGVIEQTPPAHSALKFEGRNYYDYARAGVEIPRKPRAVRIDAIELVDWAPPHAVVRVVCSKGTYIRVLAEDLATAVGSCAHLAQLRRTAAEPFRLDAAMTLDALETMSVAARDALLLPADSALASLARLDVDAPTALALVQGRLGNAPADAAGRFRCYGPLGRFVGLVQATGGTLRSVRLARSDSLDAQ